MNRWIWVTPFVLLSAVWTLTGGCRNVAVPTFPMTNTPVPPAATATFTFTRTFTGTSTNSPTPTNTRTFTRTFTPTFTPTTTNTPGGPTNTPTNTPTDTPTFTITPTFTDTNTPGAFTDTPTPTATNTPCTATVLSTYNFDSCTQGWSLNGTVPGGETISLSTTTTHTGAGAWQAVINFDPVNNNEEININFPCGTFQDFSSASVTLWIYSTVAANAQMFCNYGTGVATCYQGYQNPGYCNGPSCAGGQTGNYATLSPGVWTMVNFKPSLTAPDGQYISKFGVQILNCNSPATVYLDDVTITTLATPTPTPPGCVTAPTFNSTYPFIWNNDNYCTLPPGWSTNNNSGTIVVPGLVLSTAQNYTVGCTGTCDSLLTGPIPFTALNQAANVEYIFPNGTAGTDLTGRTISAWYYLDATPSSVAYGQMYIQDGSIGGYNYQSYGFGGTYALVTGAWTQVSIPANQGGLDPTGVWKVGIQVGTGSGPGTGYQNVNLYVDDMTIQ